MTKPEPTVLKTTRANMNVPSPYSDLYVTYGTCPSHDNRGSYLRILIQCKQYGFVIHEVVHVLRPCTNQRTSVAVMRDIKIMLRLLQRKLTSNPTSRVTIEICDLSAYLFVTHQRRVINRQEDGAIEYTYGVIRKTRKPIRVILGDYQFSRELVDHVDHILATTTKITPTLEAMGYVDKRHEYEVTEVRTRLGLWK